MPFADKFRAMMAFPFPGDALGEMTVESVEVGHEGRAPGLYAYPVRMVLRGPGGQAATLRAVKPLLNQRCTTFSGYGNPYQLWFGKPEIESLGDARYAVTVEGTGARVHLEEDLARFAECLASTGQLNADPSARAALVADYLAQYRGKVQRLVGRYRTRIKRASGS
ncbi:MAG: hypothetical protein V1772_05645 [Chloroflexota bacterium]